MGGSKREALLLKQAHEAALRRLKAVHGEIDEISQYYKQLIEIKRRVLEKLAAGEEVSLEEAVLAI